LGCYLTGGEFTVELDAAPVSQIVPAKPLGVDMGRVLAVSTVLTSIATSGATASLIIMAVTFGLILPRMLFERVLPAPA
jgi:hypothetical protein